MLLAAIWLAGCTTAGYKQGDTAALDMQWAAGEVQAESRTLELAIGALNALVTQPADDLKPQFVYFSHVLDQLASAATRVENTRLRINQKNAAYFQAWDKELAGMDYGMIRNVSQSRRTEVSNRLDRVERRYQETQAVVWPMITYLQDIRRALNADLTAGGLTAMKNVVEHSRDNAAKVQTGLAALADELADASSRLSSVPSSNASPDNAVPRAAATAR